MSDRRPGFRLLSRRVLGVDAAALPFCLGLAWWVGGRSGVIGGLVGNAFGLVNLLGMAWLIARLIAGSSQRRQGAYGFFIAVKLVVMLCIVWLLLDTFQVHPGGFVIGYSAVMLALMGAAGLAARSATRDEAQ